MTTELNHAQKMLVGKKGAPAPEVDPLWYKDAVIYQLHVRGFHDSTGDGVGDFVGLTQKLDYLQELGVTAIWILPFYPSPLKDDGYDIANYTDVNPAYGTLRDFKVFLREAHARGLRVITELVLNHTSDRHPWFQRARRAKPDSPHRNFYVWSDTPDKYLDARIIFKDFETSNWTWDPVANAYYWHRFYSHQPDLNFENPQVREALFHTLDFWLRLGVDGLRLDAVPYLYEREGTNCENLPETHAFLKALRKHVDEKFSGRMLLAEANQWPEDAIAYFGDGDECHTAFHFPIMPRLFMSKHMEDRFPIVDILQQTPEIPETCQWCVFLRNHDELTLEMVTDEERDYMYRVYAHDPQARINLGIRRRLAPLLNNNRRTIELLNGLLFSLPGTPIVYYGDEIGMGDNIYLGDRNGVRTPMQWTADRNAGFSRANPQRLYLPLVIDPEYLYESVNVETQRNNPQSLWWWMKRLIALRQRHPAFSRGSLEILNPENSKVFAFIRKYQGELILVVANLSRFVQYVELDMVAYEGCVPVELFGQNRFPPIGRLPYLLTLGPHAFYWFSLETQELQAADAGGGKDVARINVPSQWSDAFEGRPKGALEQAIRAWLPNRRWFGGKARTIQTVSIIEMALLGRADAQPRAQCISLVKLEYVEGEPDVYLLPLGWARGEDAERLVAEAPHAVVARISVRDAHQSGILFDATIDTALTSAWLEAIVRRRKVAGKHGELVGTLTPRFREVVQHPTALQPTPARAEQSNSSIVFGDKAIMKLFRRVEWGVNPELEIGKFLMADNRFTNTAPILGAVEYHRNGSEPTTLAVLTEMIPQAETAWQFTLDSVGRFFEQVLALPPECSPSADGMNAESLWELSMRAPSQQAEELIGQFLQSAVLLGQRTAEMHLALSRGEGVPAFAPEPFSQLQQRSMYQSARKLAVQKIQLLRQRINTIPPAAQSLAQSVLDKEPQIFERFQSIMDRKISATRVRCHGDYHLGQVLHTGKDFVIIDFEGEPARSLSERRIKRSPLQDVAGMVRSLHYASSQGLAQLVARGLDTPENIPRLRQAASFWYYACTAAFLQGYRTAAANASFFPSKREEQDLLLNFYLLEKAIYEMGYELNNRPDWVETPLTGIIDLLAVPL